MVYYKLILNDKRANAADSYPIEVRITFNRKNTSITTGIRVEKKDWDSTSQMVLKSNQNFQTLNKSIQEIYLKIQKFIHQLDDSDEFSFESLRENLKGKPIVSEIAFFEYSSSLIKNMLTLNQTGNSLVYQTAINRFLKFNVDKNLKFSDIDYTLLNKFKEHLQKDGVKQNTVSNYFRTLKAIYNKGIKDKLVERSKYPFYDISIKTERTQKRALPLPDFKKLIQIDLNHSPLKLNSREYLIISFCLIGTSFTDIAYLKKTNIRKDRIIFLRRKTGKEYNIKITPYLKERLLASKNNSDYLLPIITPELKEDSLEAKKIIHQWIKTTNKYLNKIAIECNIEDKVTTYVARHTWATTAKKLGYSNEMIAQALGHEYGNKITNIYLDGFDKTLVDEMNEDVLNQTFKLI